VHEDVRVRRATSLLPVAPALALALPLALAGCAQDATEDPATRPRPPAPVVVTAAVRNGRVALSPARVGAGPVEVLVSNQTRAPQRLTLEPDAGAAGVRRSAGPVPPRGTARLALDLTRGTYALRTGDPAIRPGALRVGPPRPASDDALLLP